MISDKKLPKPVDELDSHFKTWHHGLSSSLCPRFSPRPFPDLKRVCEKI
jgi:hypothetical protein